MDSLMISARSLINKLIYLMDLLCVSQVMWCSRVLRNLLALN